MVTGILILIVLYSAYRHISLEKRLYSVIHELELRHAEYLEEFKQLKKADDIFILRDTVNSHETQLEQITKRLDLAFDAHVALKRQIKGA